MEEAGEWNSIAADGIDFLEGNKWWQGLQHFRHCHDHILYAYVTSKVIMEFDRKGGGGGRYDKGGGLQLIHILLLVVVILMVYPEDPCYGTIDYPILWPGEKNPYGWISDQWNIPENYAK